LQALLRPGRLDRIIYVPLPDAETRLEIFNILKRKTPFAEDIVLDTLVEKTDGYSGAEVGTIFKFPLAKFYLFGSCIKFFLFFFSGERSLPRGSISSSSRRNNCKTSRMAPL
jgi:hypothetical protein